MCCALLLAALPAPRLHALDLPIAKIDSLSCASFAPGPDEALVLAGTDLEGVDRLWFSHPGISAAFVKDKAFTVKVDPSVPEGLYDMRAVGKNGVSNPRTIMVGRSQAQRRTGECSLALPMDIALGVPVSGATVAAARDHFRIKLRQGQRVTVRCAARELDSRLVPLFSVLGEGGRRLASNERREQLSFTAPKEGAYLVVLNDLQFGGGAEFGYRLLVDESPILEAVVPSAVQPGMKNRLTLFGRGLSGSVPAPALAGRKGEPMEMLAVEVEVPPLDTLRGSADATLPPSAAGLPVFVYRLRGPSGASNGLPLAVVDTPVLAVQGQGTAGAASAKDQPAPLVPVPGAFSGFFEKGFGGTRLEFDAKKGEVVFAEVFAQRLGFPSVNAFLRLEKAGAHLAEAYSPEQNIGGPKLNLLHNDPTMRMDIKEDGRYSVVVSDLSGADRPGTTAVHTVVLRRDSPDFRLVAALDPPAADANDRKVEPRGVTLRAGGTVGIRVVALRGGGFNEAIELGAVELPPGVACEPTRIPAGKTEGVLILRADPGLAKGSAVVRLEGRSADGKLVRPASVLATGWTIADTNLDTASQRLARGEGLVLGMAAEPAPLTLAASVNGAPEATVGGSLEVGVKLTRVPDFKEVLKVKAAGFAGAETVKEVDADAKTGEVKVKLDLGALKVPAGRHTVYFTTTGKAKIAGRDVVTTAYSTPVSFEVRPPAPKAEAKPDTKAEVKPEAKPAVPGESPK